MPRKKTSGVAISEGSKEPRRFGYPALVLVVLAGILPLLACGSSLEEPEFNGEGSGNSYEYSVPEQLQDGWTTGSLSSLGVDSTRLVQLMNDLRRHRGHLIHAILLVKDGVLAFEEYFSGDRYVSPGVGEPILFTRETSHFQASVTKSITATVVGILRDRGLLELDTPALSFFPDLADLAVAGREAITLEDLITMRSGLPWDESSTSYENPANDVTQLFYNPDPIRYILSKDMEAPAGTFFRYNSGCTNLLGKVAGLVSGQRLDSLAQAVLFDPLGIQDVYWEMIRDNLVFASGGLHLRPRDMAKIGEMYLREGVWNGARVVSPEWVAESRTSRSSLAYGWADGYGYGWWTRTYSTAAGPVQTYFAAGWGEQQIVVIPELEAVAVFTGGAYDSSPYRSPGQIVDEYILPALLNGG